MKPSAIYRISRWEFSRQFSGLDRQSVVVAVLILALTGGIVGFVGGTPDISSELYTVGVTDDSPFEPALEDRTEIRTVTYSSEAELTTAYDTGAVDVALYDDGGVREQPTDHGAAALSNVHSAVDAYNTDQLQAETDSAAAYPVAVSISYIPQRSDAVQQQASGGTGADDTDGSTADEVEQEANDLENEAFEQDGLPGDLEPPFPFESLLLAFAFIIPMNFIVQAYASSIIEERLNRRGELLLSTPISSYDIVAGKTLPYFSALTAFIAAVALGIGVGVLSVLALIPFAFAYLASGFVAGIFARSYKELTFVVFTASMFFTAFAFLPAMFTSVLPIASISPLTVVVQQLEGNSVSLTTLLFSITPMFFSGALMFILGVGIYQEEDLFTQLSVYNKFIDALGEQVHSWRSMFLVTAASMPFVIAAELLAVASLFLVPLGLSIPVLLTILALVEEIAKSLPIYAGFERDILPRTSKVAVLAGALSGFGFFVAEKSLAITQSVGLTDITLGEIAFSGALLTGGTETTAGIVLLLFFPIIHSVTTVISALGASRGRWPYISCLVAATLVHVTYNLTAVVIYG